MVQRKGLMVICCLLSSVSPAQDQLYDPAHSLPPSRSPLKRELSMDGENKLGPGDAVWPLTIHFLIVAS